MPTDKKPVDEPHAFQRRPAPTRKRNPDAKDEGDSDVAMTDATVRTADLTLEDELPEAEAVFLADVRQNLTFLEKGVANFESRYAVRALRSTASVRQRLTPERLAVAINAYFPKDHQTKLLYLDAIGAKSTLSGWPGLDVSKDYPKFLPEGIVYFGLLLQMYFLDLEDYAQGHRHSASVIEYVHNANRRTLDTLSARAYFYWALFYEVQNKTAEVRPHLLDALRLATVRHDSESEATLLNLLLRNYLQDNLYDQADKLASKTTFPETASNNQTARYLYYLGRIKAIQLDYTESHRNLQHAIRKAPQTPATAGFQQAVYKVSVIVQLLMGEIPERSIFRLKTIRKSLIPYLHIVQAVRVGDLGKFQDTLAKYGDKFRSDKTYTLILRLRHNVIKTGIRMISLSYSRISMHDICRKLRLDSEEDAEFIVAKAIRDGVLDATLDREKAFMQSKEIVDIYSTNEPQSAFHQRIAFCLEHHNNSVKAMRFPMNAHQKELETAKAARQRERELAQEIAEGGHESEDEEF